MVLELCSSFLSRQNVDYRKAPSFLIDSPDNLKQAHDDDTAVLTIDKLSARKHHQRFTLFITSQKIFFEKKVSVAHFGNYFECVKPF